MDWMRVLAYVTRTVDQELMARNEYLAAENRILRAQLKGRLKLSDPDWPPERVDGPVMPASENLHKTQNRPSQKRPR